MAQSQFKQEHEARKAVEEQLTETTRQNDCIDNFIAAHREIAPIEANIKIIKMYYGNLPEEITAQSLEESLTHSKLRAMLAFQDEHKERTNLVEYIISNRQMSPQAAASERERLMSPMSTAIETVRTIAEAVKNKRAMQAMSKEDLQEIAASQKHQQPELPSHINRAQILHMMDANQLRHIIDRYGRDAVNKRLQEGLREQKDG